MKRARRRSAARRGGGGHEKHEKRLAAALAVQAGLVAKADSLLARRGAAAVGAALLVAAVARLDVRRRRGSLLGAPPRARQGLSLTPRGEYSALMSKLIHTVHCGIAVNAAPPSPQQAAAQPEPSAATVIIESLQTPPQVLRIPSAGVQGHAVGLSPRARSPRRAGSPRAETEAQAPPTDLQQRTVRAVAASHEPRGASPPKPQRRLTRDGLGNKRRRSLLKRRGVGGIRITPADAAASAAAAVAASGSAYGLPLGVGCDRPASPAAKEAPPPQRPPAAGAAVGKKRKASTVSSSAAAAAEYRAAAVAVLVCVGAVTVGAVRWCVSPRASPRGELEMFHPPTPLELLELGRPIPDAACTSTEIVPLPSPETAPEEGRERAGVEASPALLASPAAGPDEPPLCVDAVAFELDADGGWEGGAHPWAHNAPSSTPIQTALHAPAPGDDNDDPPAAAVAAAGGSSPPLSPDAAAAGEPADLPPPAAGIAVVGTAATPQQRPAAAGGWRRGYRTGSMDSTTPGAGSSGVIRVDVVHRAAGAGDEEEEEDPAPAAPAAPVRIRLPAGAAGTLPPGGFVESMRGYRAHQQEGGVAHVPAVVGVRAGEDAAACDGAAAAPAAALAAAPKAAAAGSSPRVGGTPGFQVVRNAAALGDGVEVAGEGLRPTPKHAPRTPRALAARVPPGRAGEGVDLTLLAADEMLEAYGYQRTPAAPASPRPRGGDPHPRPTPHPYKYLTAILGHLAEHDGPERPKDLVGVWLDEQQREGEAAADGASSARKVPLRPRAAAAAAAAADAPAADDAGDDKPRGRGRVVIGRARTTAAPRADAAAKDGFRFPWASCVVDGAWAGASGAPPARTPAVGVCGTAVRRREPRESDAAP